MPRMQVRRCRLVERDADTMLDTYIHLGLEGAPDATSSPSYGKLHTWHTKSDKSRYPGLVVGVQSRELLENKQC